MQFIDKINELHSLHRGECQTKQDSKKSKFAVTTDLNCFCVL